MPVTIRSPRAEDYPVLAAIHNEQNEPDWHTTPGRLAASDARSEARTSLFRRLVVEDAGQLLATGTIHGDFGDPPQPGRRWVYLFTHSDHRGRGLDRQMLRRALALDPGPVSEVATTIRADFIGMTSFLEEEGFKELYRTWGSHLDLKRFDAAAFEPLTAELEKQGVRLVPYSDLAQAAELVDRIIAFQREAEEDSLAFEPVIPRRQDDLMSEYAMPDTLTLALTGKGEIVGMSSLVGPPRGEMIEIGFTGVARSYRRRGIATALEAHTASRARELGFTDLNAAGAGGDSPNLRVKRRLGYDIEPAWITFAKRY